MVIILDLHPYLVIYKSGVHFQYVSSPLFNILASPFLFSYTNAFWGRVTCKSPNTLFCFSGNDWSLMNDYPSSLATYSLDIYSPLFLYPARSSDMLSSETLNPNPTSSIRMKRKTLYERKFYRISSS